MKTDDIIVIPDVHGRRFWRDAVAKYPEADTIFLGDYHDPYPAEGISVARSLANFEELIDYASRHDNVHLLLGNHDLHYLCNFGEACRYDYKHAPTVHALLVDNIDRMHLAETRLIGGKKVLFTHAPVISDWLEAVGETDHVDLLVSRLNRLLDDIITDPGDAEQMLGMISDFRGGDLTYGSPVWADVREIIGGNLIATPDYSVFGHTQMADAVITDDWAMLDCRRAFRIDSELKIHET